MKVALIALLLCDAAAGEISPLQKVVQLLADLETEIKADGEKEVAAFDQYSAWGKSEVQERGLEFKTATAQLGAASTKIPKAAADTEAARSRIEDLAAGVATDGKDLKDATEIRCEAHADFAALEAELVDTISPLDRALKVLVRKFSSLAQTSVNTNDVSLAMKAIRLARP